MGNCVVTAHWDPCDKDEEIKTALRRVALSYGGVDTNVDANLAHYRTGSTSFSGQIAGLSVVWHGGSQVCMRTVQQLGNAWRETLQLTGAQGIAIHDAFLPM